MPSSRGRLRSQGAVYGGADVPLSANGEAEARAAASMIAAGGDVTDGLPIAAVFCSPLARAVYGARAVAEACGLPPPTALDGLREVGRGDWYGLTPDEISDKYGASASMATFLSSPSFRPPGGGESLEDVAARVRTACDVVLANLEPGTTAVVVSHLFVTRTAVLAALQAQGVATSIGDIAIPTASISCVEYAAAGLADGAVVFSGRKPEALSASTNDLTGAS